MYTEEQYLEAADNCPMCFPAGLRLLRQPTPRLGATTTPTSTRTARAATVVQPPLVEIACAMKGKYRLAIIDEDGLIHQVMDDDSDLSDYELTWPIAQNSLCEDIIHAIEDADRARGIK